MFEFRKRIYSMINLSKHMQIEKGVSSLENFLSTKVVLQS